MPGPISNPPSNGRGKRLSKSTDASTATGAQGKPVQLPKEMKRGLIDDGWVIVEKEDKHPNIPMDVQSVRGKLDLWSREYHEAVREKSIWERVLGFVATDGKSLLSNASKLADRMLRQLDNGLEDEEFVLMINDYLKLEKDDPRKRFAVRYLINGMSELVKAIENEKDADQRVKMMGSMGMLFFTTGMKGLGNGNQVKQLTKMLLSTPTESSIAFAYFNGLFADPSNQSPELKERRDAFINHLISRQFDIPQEVGEFELTTFIDLMPFPGLKSSEAYVVKILTVLDMYMKNNPRPSDQKIEEYCTKFKLGFRGLDPHSEDGRQVVDMLRLFEEGLADKNKKLFGRQLYPFESDLKKSG